MLLGVAAWLWIVPAVNYSVGMKAQEAGEYEKAMNAFQRAGDYKDANKREGESRRANAYTLGEEAFEQGDYAAAVKYYEEAKNYEDAQSMKQKAELGVLFSEGEALLAEGKYEEAAKKFEQANGFPQASAKLTESKEKLAQQLLDQGDAAKAGEVYASIGKMEDMLSCAKLLIEQRQFEDAHTLLASFDDASLEPYQLCAAGLAAYAEGNFEDAVKTLEQVKDLPEAAKMLPEIYYEQGKALTEEGSYQKAKNAFANAGEYSDAAEQLTKVTFLMAEKYYKDGYLNHAKAAYESVPGDYSLDGVSAADRLATLEKYKAFLGLCGKWQASSSKNRIETRETYNSGYYYYWYLEPGSYSGSIVVTCKIRDDGTVLVEGTAEFMRYTNYSSNSYNLKTDTKSVSFSKTSTTVPRNFDSGNLKLSFNGKLFVLKYQTKDNSKSYATFTYTSDYQYDRRTEAY